jgi:hypothetical protein
MTAKESCNRNSDAAFGTIFRISTVSVFKEAGKTSRRSLKNKILGNLWTQSL